MNQGHKHGVFQQVPSIARSNDQNLRVIGLTVGFCNLVSIHGSYCKLQELRAQHSTRDIERGLMPALPKTAHFNRILAAVCLLLISTSMNYSRGDDTRLSEPLVQASLDTLSLIVGFKLGPNDQGWLRDQWAEEFADQPEATVAALEAFAVVRNDIDVGSDPMTLARLRNQVIDGSYCAPKKSGDPKTARQRSIFAPDDLVLAADCVAGAVVTPFDVKALAKSNAFVGELVGNPVNVAKVEEELFSALASSADDWNPEGWQRMLWAELRAAALQEFWESADQATRDQWTAAAKETFQSNNHVGSTALSLEKTALKEVGAIQVIAENGEHRFRAWEMNAYLDHFAFVTGAALSPSERDEISSMFVTGFHKNPVRIVENAQFARHWLDREYYFGKDPQTGRIRSWTPKEQARKRNQQAAELFCVNNEPGNSAGQRLLEILYTHNPVIDVDCTNYQIMRQSDQVLVDVDGRQLTRAALDAHRYAFELTFAFQFSDEERQWFDEASINDMQNGSIGLTQAVDGFQRIVAEIKEESKIGPHLNEQRRENMAIQIHCANTNAKHPDERRLFEIINQHDPILYEDCDRQLVFRESDLGGLVAIYNFFASLADLPPLTEAEIDALPDRLQIDFEKSAGGSFGYLSTFAKYTYWWSHMPVGKRYQAAAAVKQEVTSADGIFAYAWGLNDLAGFQLAKLALCDLQIKKLAFNTRRVELSSRSIFTSDPYAGSAWVNPEDIFNGIEYYGVMAPFIQEQCGNVWN